MEIHIHRDGLQYGPYSQEEITKQLRDGALTPDDLAWYEGAAEWIPLRTLPGISLPSSQPAPPTPSVQSTPKLWNPNAAANWSLLFTPILGAWLHAKNWKELDQPDKSQKSMIWVYVGFVFLIVVLFLPDNVGSGPGLIFILAWYFSSAKGQVKYLKENNIIYNKKTWGKPLLLGLGGLVAYFVIAIAIISSTEPSISEVLEAESVSLVTQIVKEQLGGTATCKAVSIEKAVSDGFYHAVTYLDNGNELKIAIEHKGDQIFVTVPDQ